MATRQNPGDRDQADIGSEEELEKEAFRMAEGGEEGCRLARDPEPQKEILELLKTWIEGQDLS